MGFYNNSSRQYNRGGKKILNNRRYLYPEWRWCRHWYQHHHRMVLLLDWLCYSWSLVETICRWYFWPFFAGWRSWLLQPLFAHSSLWIHRPWLGLYPAGDAGDSGNTIEAVLFFMWTINTEGQNQDFLTDAPHYVRDNSDYSLLYHTNITNNQIIIKL